MRRKTMLARIDGLKIVHQGTLAKFQELIETNAGFTSEDKLFFTRFLDEILVERIELLETTLKQRFGG